MKIRETIKGQRAGICADSILAAIGTQQDILAPLTPRVQAVKKFLDGDISKIALDEIEYQFEQIDEFIMKWRPTKNPDPDYFYIQPNWASIIDNETQNALNLLSLLKEEFLIGSYTMINRSSDKTHPSEVNKGDAFIAMAIDPMNPDLDDVHDAIKETCKKHKIDAKRVDEDQSNERITDRIVASIKSAEFVIADLTYSRPNVFFEAGFAHGLDKTPIYVAKHGTKLEFDIKDYPIIFFKSMRDLKSKLSERLKSILGED